MRTLPLLALAALLPLAACQKESPTPAASDSANASSQDEGLIARTARQAMEKAKTELTQGNIAVGGRGAGSLSINGTQIGGENSRSENLPKAEISPAGDFLIDGKAVTIDQAQRALLLAHRDNIIAIAHAGIDIGIQGASLGAKAATGALASVFSGKTEEFEQRMANEGKKMEAHALKLCDHLPNILLSQQALAAAVPEFKPYAVLEKDDLDECKISQTVTQP